ncbi:hypothetical protein Fleli_1244 [Bernardetia litoralis DSM 6794]|uniref:Uncharacterized protein n=1 Tax=Bernardetia litoralis (strain ATCC 23117 / DSM 6794 / NBRC 15988 / NCIMB 1366 / Fx l1 / Sio-4) TaxID=880071 RepID=I4AI95_BERLS|nr:hypothetical protein Fleli_1244 [Bernardetia litoralis DSM 6794]
MTDFVFNSGKHTTIISVSNSSDSEKVLLFTNVKLVNNNQKLIHSEFLLTDFNIYISYQLDLFGNEVPIIRYEYVKRMKGLRLAPRSKQTKYFASHLDLIRSLNDFTVEWYFHKVNKIN